MEIPTEKMERKRVAIIGAGASGIPAAKLKKFFLLIFDPRFKKKKFIEKLLTMDGFLLYLTHQQTLGDFGVINLMKLKVYLI
jgi:predicted flavoprotein YhiN